MTTTHHESLPLQLVDELATAEPILRGVLEQQPVRGPVEGVAGDLFEDELAARLEDPGDLRHGGPPVGDVVDDAEVRDGVHAPVGDWQGRHVPELDLGAIFVP